MPTPYPQPPASALGIERELFVGAAVSLGIVRCPAGHPSFGARARVEGYRVVFPRHGVWITPARAPRYRSDASIVEFYNDGEELTREALDPRGDRTEWFALGDSVLREMIARYDPQSADADRLLRRPYAPVDPRAYADQRILFRDVRRGLKGDFAIEEAAINVVDRILRRTYNLPASSVVTRHEREIVERVRHVLDRIGNDRASLAAIAREAAVSMFHLCRIFRKVTGRTLARHHLHLRLLASLEHLDESDRSLDDIASAHGFRSRAHYGQAFRRTFGTSPGAWRALPAAKRRSLRSR